MDTKPLNPITHGDTAIFEWRGAKAPVLIGDFNRWNTNQAIQLNPVGKELWRYNMKLPENAYIEYTCLLNGKRVDDPNNPRHVYNGMRSHNHYFYMPAAIPTPFARPMRGVPKGKVKDLKVEGRYYLGGKEHGIDLFTRNVHFYQPPVSQAVPLLVVFDGPDYQHRAKLPVILDNLIEQKRIRPIALAMVAHGGRQRFIEYACSDVTLGFLRFSLLPVARKELNLLDYEKAPGCHSVLGASMGGLISLYAGLRMPDIFGNVLSQSGAFYPKFVVNDLIEKDQAKEIKIWMDAGTMEYLIDFNREMHQLLLRHGYNVSYNEYHGGHNYSAWRDDLVAGLENLFS